MFYRLIFLLLSVSLLSSCCVRHTRTACDITPENAPCTRMDWRYGASDIRIQTFKVTQTLMDRWCARTGYNFEYGKPRIIITEVDNRTDCYISTEMIRDTIESVAVDDGRFTVVVGNKYDEGELDYLMAKISQDPKYCNSTRLCPIQAKAPQFLAKIRITKAVTSDCKYDFEDYRMTITLYDIETQEIIDSTWDVLNKKVNLR